MCVGIGLKLILYYFCTRQSTPSSALLAMDQRNDVVTSVVALAGALIGNYYWLYADPIGAVLVWYVFIYYKRQKFCRETFQGKSFVGKLFKEKVFEHNR